MLSLEYIAGLIDGEGSILVSKKRRKENRSGYIFLAYANITNTNKEVLEAIKEVLGGYFHLHEGPSKPRKSFHYTSKKDCWRLVWQGKKACEMLEKLRPFLFIKAKQADNVLELGKVRMNSKNYGGYNFSEQEKLWLKSKELNS